MTKPSDPTWYSEIQEPLVVADPETVRWDEQADLVVVGFGGAGAVAAAEAAQAGAKVIVIDRYLGGGDTALSGGILYAGGGTPQQKEAGVQDDPEEMYKYLAQETQGVVSDETLRLFCDQMLQTEVQRLIVDRDGAVVGVEGLQMTPGTKAAKRHALIARILIWMRVLAITLVPKVAKKMTAFERESRNPRLIRAKRGVVLATGGFVRNRSMVREYLPQYYQGTVNGGLGCNGSGIRLGESVGGASDLNRASAWRFINPPKAFSQGIVVNAEGDRFCNEGAYGAQIGYHMCEEQGGRAWLILNRRLFHEARSQCAPGKEWFFQWFMALLTMYFARKQGETIEALAQACGMSAEKLRNAIETYSAAAIGQIPDPFRKGKDFMADIREGPYYALDISLDSKLLPCAVITFGGLLVDEQTGQVKGEDGAGIPGLYAAGRTAIGIPSNHYVSGLAIADCIFSGRRAARAILRGS